MNAYLKNKSLKSEVLMVAILAVLGAVSYFILKALFVSDTLNESETIMFRTTTTTSPVASGTPTLDAE